MPDEMEEIIGEFITEAEESLDRIDPLFIGLEAKGYDKDILNEIFRSMHTIKGAAGFLGFQSIVDVAHSSENILKKLRDGNIPLTKNLIDAVLKSVDMIRLLIKRIKDKDPEKEDITSVLKELDHALTASSEPAEAYSACPPDTIMQETEDFGDRTALHDSQEPCSERGAPERKELLHTLRVDINKIDKVMDLAGEVVLVRNRLVNIVNDLGKRETEFPFAESLNETVAFLDLVTTDMHLSIVKMRMQPIQKVFSKFPRLVRDISGNLGKEVNLSISGEDTEVDKSVIEQIGDPMVHIIRNSIDHGLESPEEREAKKKPRKGNIAISAYQKGNQIIIEVSDDGRGIDIERVKKKAREKLLITEEEAQRLTDESAINLIFAPGFSTADFATELSGRGVGMDVVKTNVSKLNGYVEVTTRKDIGTTFKITIPLTLAIIQALMVKTSGSHYAIPLSPVEEILKVSNRDITDVMGQKVLDIRGKVCPFVELSDILANGGPNHTDFRYAVVVSVGEKKFCLAVDELLGLEEVFIKAIKGIDAVSPYTLGATIAGDGKVVLILDLAGISRNIFGRMKIEHSGRTI